MGMNLKHDFKESALALLRGVFVNRLARFCSFWCEGAGIHLHMPDNPSGGNPNKVELDVPMAAQLIDSYQKSKRMSYSMPLAISAQMNNDGSAVASLHVYLPQTSVRIGGKTLAFAEGSGFGRISDDGDSSSYTIRGITYGSIYVHSVIAGGEATDELQFDTVGSSVEGAVSLLVATVTQSGVVTQYPACLTGDLRIAGEGAMLPKDDREPIDVGYVHGGSYNDSAPELETDEWKRESATEGRRVVQISRVLHSSSNPAATYWIVFRWATYDRFGSLVEIGPEFGYIALYSR